MRQLGLKPSDTELEDIMNEIDSDHSGTIDFNGNTSPPSLQTFVSHYNSSIQNSPQ